MGRFAYSATVDVSTILTSVGARVATLLASVFADTTGWYSSVHQPGSTAMVGGVDMATTLREKATNFLSSAVFLAKDKWNFSTPQRTRRRRGGAVNDKEEGRSLLDGKGVQHGESLNF